MKKAEKPEDKLPLIYRLILKLPSPLKVGLSSFLGIFWAVIVPIFIVLEFFITLFLLILFPFPINIFLAGSIPTTIFIIFVRIQLQRGINLWNANVKERHFEWNIEKISKEYFSLLNAQKSEETKTKEHQKG